MKVVVHGKPRCSLEAFADLYNLTMEIRERAPLDMGPRWSTARRYYARFRDCEIRDGATLRTVSGDGATPDEAMAEYAAKISGQRLVINALRNGKRMEVTAPLLTHAPLDPRVIGTGEG